MSAHFVAGGPSSNGRPPSAISGKIMKCGADTAWRVRWSATERALIAVHEESGYCEATGPAIDARNRDDRWLCQLPEGHFGAHSWQMPSITTGSVPSSTLPQTHARATPSTPTAEGSRPCLAFSRSRAAPYAL
ncbi:hypothetical protein [Nonomuraea sp. KM88]|uniref:hypothetical protein n=1 Tax=Nonomuraea sp. KM88 TaxID=3457427 RepID=UPI003FCE4596